MSTAHLVWLEGATVRDGGAPWPLYLGLGSGVHAVVGTPADGTLSIAPLLAGVAPLGSGRAMVDGGAPHHDPRLRARVGALLETPLLPPFGRVAGLFAQAASFTSIDPTILVRLGLGTLADRLVAGLARSEARAVELALALGLVEPSVIVLTEPLADVSSLLDRGALLQVIAEKGARSGTAVVIVTASTSDALDAGATLHLFQRGRVVRTVPASDPAALVPGGAVELCVSVDLPRLLLGALSEDPSVTGVRWDGQEDRSLLIVRGDDLARLSLVVTEAALRTGATIRSVEPRVAGLDEALAASAGLAMAAYQAGYRAGTVRP